MTTTNEPETTNDDHCCPRLPMATCATRDYQTPEYDPLYYDLSSRSTPRQKPRPLRMNTPETQTPITTILHVSRPSTQSTAGPEH